MEINMHTQRRVIRVHFGKVICLAFRQGDAGPKTTPLFPSQTIRNAACTGSRCPDSENLVCASASGQGAKKIARVGLRRLCRVLAVDELVVYVRRFFQIHRCLGRPLSAGFKAQEYSDGRRIHVGDIPLTTTIKE